ncbi:hypothetical protein EX30DRAFT_352157 [Ascodesmis nigricans]|uniref:C2H2-type domain-containing protein n=1 Tax=Ascodesmis nigricans TaxID=341454 RepID=A0A4S2MJE7_9PEZI|nr:hypothetical protein EX30DRAFT_352157 [Ascodesmis nigricans]
MSPFRSPMPGYEFDMKMEFASPDHHQTTGIDAIMVGSTPRLYPRPGTGEWTYPSDDLNAPRSYIPIGRGIHAREGFQQPLAGTAYGAGGNFVPRYTGSTGIHTDAWNPMPMVDSPPQGYGYANGSGIDMAAEWNVAILGTPPMKLVVPLTPLLPSASPQDMDSQDGFGSTHTANITPENGHSMLFMPTPNTGTPISLPLYPASPSTARIFSPCSPRTCTPSLGEPTPGNDLFGSPIPSPGSITSETFETRNPAFGTPVIRPLQPSAPPSFSGLEPELASHDSSKQSLAASLKNPKKRIPTLKRLSKRHQASPDSQNRLPHLLPATPASMELSSTLSELDGGEQSPVVNTELASAHQGNQAAPVEYKYTCQAPGCKCNGTRVFLRRSALQRHEEEHLKPYLCHIKGCKRSIPGNGFSRPDNLRTHLNSKTLHAGLEDDSSSSRKRRRESTFSASTPRSEPDREHQFALFSQWMEMSRGQAVTDTPGRTTDYNPRGRSLSIESQFERFERWQEHEKALEREIGEGGQSKRQRR